VKGNEVTEQEYVAVSNRARVWAANDILRNVMPEGSVQRSLLAAAMKALSDLSDDLKESISVDE
jgi:hypothetical protein